MTEVLDVSLLGPDGPGEEGGETVSNRDALLLGAVRITAGASTVFFTTSLSAADEAVRSAGGTYSAYI